MCSMDGSSHRSMTTDPGIEKNGMADVQYKEIEQLVAAVRTLVPEE